MHFFASSSQIAYCRDNCYTKHFWRTLLSSFYLQAHWKLDIFVFFCLGGTGVQWAGELDGKFHEQFWSLKVEDWSKHFFLWRHSIYIHYFPSIFKYILNKLQFVFKYMLFIVQVHRFISNNTVQLNMLPRHACMNPWIHSNT